MDDRALSIIEKYDRALNGAEDRVIERVNAALEAAYDRLESELLRAYETYSGDLDLLPAQRKLLILQELGDLLSLVNTRNAEQIQADFEALLQGTYEQGLSLSGELASAIGNETLKAFADVPLEAIRAQAEDSSRRLSRWSEDMRGKISGIVELNLATGAGTRKIASQLRSELGILKGRAEAIARTEVLSSLNQATQANYRRNNIEAVQLIATSDDRTCPYCLARNGYVYELGKISVPIHVQCRCYLSPWRAEWQRAGLTNDQWIEDFRAVAIEEFDGDLNYGVSPFEKSAGLTEPPTPIWKPRA